jgi:hypothetical protein
MNKKMKNFLIVFSLIILFVMIYFLSKKKSDTTIYKESWQNRETQISQIESELKNLAEKIKENQGHSRCKQDSDCRVIGLGAKTCGKYKDFLIYSILDANEPTLLELVSKFNELHQKLQDLSLKANRCGTDPLTVHCKEGVCEI